MFNPANLAPPLAVNPQRNWQIRINLESERVDFKGMEESLNLTVNGINFAPDKDDPTQIYIWADTKENSMTLKGKATSGKMAALIAFLKKGGILEENHKSAYLKTEQDPMYPTYYKLMLDTEQKNELKEMDTPEDTSDEPANEEILDTVEADN